MADLHARDLTIRGGFGELANARLEAAGREWTAGAPGTPP
jgi:hypothetical protein